MKILLLVAEHGFAFINQAKALSKGISNLKITNKVARISPLTPVKKILEDFRPDFVIGIGSWRSYPTLVKEPKSLGYKTIPWIVSDEKIDQFIHEYNLLNLILTTSQYCEKVFIRDGINKEILKIVPEAVDTDFWHQLAEKELQPFLKLISISEPDLSLPFNFDLAKIHEQKIPVLFTTGGDATSKGAQEVINALAKLDKKIPWIYLIKTWPSEGSFKHSAAELKLVKQFGLYEKVRYIVGEFSRDFVRGLMSTCDIYVAPSRSEGFGLPLVEAQFCEKPVISMKATSTQEIVKDGITGFLVPSKDINGQPRADTQELSTALQKMLTDSNLRKKMGKKAKVFVTENFSPTVIASKLTQHLEEKTA